MDSTGIELEKAPVKWIRGPPAVVR
jgi:hypothetical protein